MSTDALIAFHHLFHAVFRRRELREWSALYLVGQLSNLQRKSPEATITAFCGADPNALRGLERFISQGTWSGEGLIQLLQERVADWLGDPDGVVIVDGNGFPRQGSHTVGVAPQYCGAMTKVAIAKKERSPGMPAGAAVPSRVNSCMSVRVGSAMSCARAGRNALLPKIWRFTPSRNCPWRCARPW